jgi:hypothetical protein
VLALSRLHRGPSDGDTLYAFYDLQVVPITYDASWFAVCTDLVRRRRGLTRVHFVVVPGRKQGLREERAAYEAAVDLENRRWRLHNIVIPIFDLLPACAGYTLLPSREAAAALRAAAGSRVYPADYEPALPVGHHPTEVLSAAHDGDRESAVLGASVQGLRYVEQWAAPRLRGRRLVTITLREYAFMPARNSSVETWAHFARRLDSRAYLPVVVLDTDRSLDPLPPSLAGLEVLPQASWNIGLRMALYQSAYLNLGVNSGPLFMCLLNGRTRALVFKMLTPSVPQTTERFTRQLGFEIGGQLPFATPYQRQVWEDDRLDVVEREFAAMVETIEARDHASDAALR